MKFSRFGAFGLASRRAARVLRGVVVLAALAACLAGDRVHAANRYWSGTGIWNTTNTNWGTAIGGPYNTATWSNSAPDAAFFEGTAGTVTLAMTATANGMTFSTTGYMVTGGTLAFGGSISVATGVTGTIESQLTRAGILTKSGQGVLRLTNTANDFTGTITAVGGVLEMAVIPNSSNRINFNGGTIRYVGASNTATNRALQIGTAGGSIQARLDSSGSGTIDYTGTAAATNGGTLTAGAGLRLGGSNTGDNFWRGALNDLSSIAIGMSKIDAGTWIVTGNSGYTGGTTISGGTLGFGSTTALGTGTVTFSANATLRAATAGTLSNIMSTGASSAVTATVDTQANAVTLSGSIGGSGNLAKIGSATLTLSSANNAYTGATTISAGTLALSGGGSVASSSGLNISNAAAAFDISAASGDRTVKALEGVAGSSVVIGGNTLTADNATTKTFGGVISGSGGFTKAGGGILTFSDVQTFTGVARVDAGTLAIDGTNTLAAASRIVVASGATLDATAAGLAVGGAQTLAGSGTVAGGFTIAGGATLAPGNSPGTLSVLGTTTWGTGGNYNWQIYTMAGGVGTGTGWDFLDSTGSLDITATDGNPFNINMWSLSGLPDTSGSVSDFNAGTSSNFLIAEFDGGITGWDPTKFSVNTGAANGTGGFHNSFVGQGAFSVARGDTVLGGNANQIYIVYAAVPEPGTLALAGIGLAMAGWAARRRRVRG